MPRTTKKKTTETATSGAAGSSRKSKKKSASGKPATWTFPKNTHEDAIRIARAIEDKHGGNPMKADILAKAVDFNRPNDWRFQDLLRSANMYGLVTGSGEKATVSLESTGRDVVAPGSPQERKKALLSAFRNVEDFKKVDEFYGKKRIPEDEYFLNTLTRQFNIPRDRVEVFADVFRKTVAFLQSFDVQTGAPGPEIEEARDFDGTTTTTSVGKERRVREFLDTCFVMMPFGTWFDRYYQEIYIPAT